MPSIAVLPFADLSPQKDQDYLCDGMTDEIIAKLSRLKGWKVIPRTSILRYKNTDKDIKAIGQELNVATILEGSVRKEKDDIRVNTKLINVEDSSPLWSDTYDQKLESVFDIQIDVAEKITKALKTKLSPEEQEKLQKRPTENLIAYNLYLQGRFFWNKRTEEGLNKAMEYFEQAIEKDPNYALAYAGLADSYIMLGDWFVHPPKEAYPKAREAATKALEIDESLGEALNSLAYVNYVFDWDWLNAERGFKRAIMLNPSYATAHQWYAEYLTTRGRFGEALTEIKRAQEFDPLSLIINAVWGWILYQAREYDQSIEQCRKTLEMDPNFYPARLFLGWSYKQKGMYKEAIEELKKSIILSGDNMLFKASLGGVYALVGRRDEALNILDELTRLSKQQYISPGMVASIYANLGEKDQAFEWLEKAYKEHDIWISEIKVSPRFDSLRSDPRFTALLKKIGLD